MNQPNPKRLFDTFSHTVAQYRGFHTRPVPFSGYDSWEHDGMHDPPKLGPGRKRAYSRVLGRRLFEIGSGPSGFLVQVDLLRTPSSGELAAVFLRSKEFPKKGRNTANATFKFRSDPRNVAFVIDFTSPPVKNRIGSTGSLPMYLRPCSRRTGRLLLPREISNELVHQLLLVTDFAGQAGHGVLLPRKPGNFYPPA